jgi:hypothetical protein
MKKINLLLSTFIGIMASSSGMIQVAATTYNYFVDFSTKEVANYTAYKQTFNEDTTNLLLEYNFSFVGSYYFDSCPSPFTANIRYQLNAQPTGGPYVEVARTELPDFVCTTTPTTYSASVSGTLGTLYLDALVNDDAKQIYFQPFIVITQSASTNGRRLYLSGYSFKFDLTYEFGTTYLFNYFLSDQRSTARFLTAGWTLGGTLSNYLAYVYTTAGNDTYYINNSNIGTIGTIRKKYAVNYNTEFFRGKSVGAGFNSVITGTDNYLLGSSGTIANGMDYFYYYLNVSNLAQAIVDAPEFNFAYDDCGSFLALNVGCFVNNALAYITNDAPIISDAITLLNAGIGLASQTFGIIGSFSDDNVFGWLILIGFGFIAVKWFLKND